jgi:hypothetical protein
MHAVSTATLLIRLSRFGAALDPGIRRGATFHIRAVVLALALIAPFRGPAAGSAVNARRGFGRTAFNSLAVLALNIIGIVGVVWVGDERAGGRDEQQGRRNRAGPEVLLVSHG